MENSGLFTEKPDAERETGFSAQLKQNRINRMLIECRPPVIRFCPHCGKECFSAEEREETVHSCAVCGYLIPFSFRICPYCGSRQTGPDRNGTL